MIDSKYWDRNLSFVAMTRHKDSLNIYADKENHRTMRALKRTLSRSTTKDNVIDWPLDYATQAGFDPDTLIGKAVNHIAGVGHKVKQAYNFVVDFETFLLVEKRQEQWQDIQQSRSIAKQKALEADSIASLVKEQKKADKPGSHLKKDMPQIDELVQLIEQRQRLSGYFAEKADKQIKVMSKEILSSKTAIKEFKSRHPELYRKIRNIFSKEKEICLARES